MATDNIDAMDAADEIVIRKKKAPEMRTGVSARGILATAAAALDELRAKKPLIHCMTNLGASNFTANALLALGASPAMVEDVGEVSQFAKIADSLLVNLGTVTKPQSDAMRAAVSQSNLGGRPWVLDPAGVGMLPLRTFVAKELMRRFPAIIRGNASEIAFLGGNEQATIRGMESTLTSKEVTPLAIRLAGVTRAAVVLSGAVDYVAAEGAPVVGIENGSPLMARVAGTGSVQGALATAFLGTLGAQARWESALAASLVSKIAGELAAKKTTAPGSFHVAYLDALAAIAPGDILKMGHVKIA
ncbi:MAG: hydroxyethylthiazole kinase [Kiritimatiellia bacterium]